MILTGPSYATGIRWGLRNRQSCVLVQQNNKENLSKCLLELKKNNKKRKEIAEYAFKNSNHEFHPLEIRQKFLEKLKPQILPKKGQMQ